VTNNEEIPPEGDLLASYAALLRGSPHNLLSPRGLEEIESRHFPESAAFAVSLPPSIRLLDVGTGGGLPGVVIAMMRPDIEVHLLEATGKKARFLEEVSAELGVAFTVHHGRAEDLAGPPLRGSFDVVTARAVAPLGRLAAWCVPYLRVGGRLHAIKGDRWAVELDEAGPAIAAARLRVVSTPREAVSDADDQRPRVVILERVR